MDTHHLQMRLFYKSLLYLKQQFYYYHYCNQYQAIDNVLFQAHIVSPVPQLL